MIYAPSISNRYGGNTFPAITDAIYDYKKNNTRGNIENIKFKLSVVIYKINSAISILKQPFDFSRTVVS